MGRTRSKKAAKAATARAPGPIKMQCRHDLTLAKEHIEWHFLARLKFITSMRRLGLWGAVSSALIGACICARAESVTNRPSVHAGKTNAPASQHAKTNSTDAAASDV